MQNHSSGAQPTPLYTVPPFNGQGTRLYQVYGIPSPQPAINFIANLILLFSLHEQPNISWLWKKIEMLTYHSVWEDGNALFFFFGYSVQISIWRVKPSNIRRKFK